MENKTLSYDEQQKIEIEKATEIRAKVVAVFKLLGLKVNKQNEVCSWRVNEKAEKDDVQLYVSSSKFEKWRVTISGGFPRTAKGEYIRPYKYDERPHEITVSGEKTPEQIAKDIENRFMPRYRELLANVKKQIESADNYMYTTKKTLRALGRSVDEAEEDSKEFHVSFKGGYGHVKASGENVSINLTSLDVQTAKKILALLPKEVAS